MIDFIAFSDELVKIASEDFKSLGVKYKGVEVKAQLPILRRLSRRPERAKAKIIRTLNRKDIPSVLGYKNVVVPESQMPSMEAMGFKPTRIATPLPGEKPFAVSYRAGTLHAHKMGPAYLVHQDKDAPTSEKGSYLNLKAIKHGLHEGIPSIIKRIREREHLVRGIEQ